ncbi:MULTISPECIES: formate/nitrite transporter family protein [unclassified Sphingomonas]|uniref:formate/nitrite transporter family protein n=1 Tax=unclassified Sphingomonas TaxID=196159 RepID=UPI0006F9EB52|nr:MULTISPECIES: formate/nitrite transporter family protein [unclassified Sphingomonas]KQS49434.1 formate transporter [Sphingomonas sp. Leaf198]
MVDNASNPPGEDVEDLKAADAQDLHKAVREAGEEELDRPVSSLFFSGLAAGMAISSSLIAEGALHQALPETPWRTIIVSLGYPIGFLVVILGRMQLFTESTISAMLPLVTKPSGWALKRTLRLWGVVLLANLIGTAITGGAIAAGVLGNSELRGAMIEVSMRITELSAWATFVNAIPAGFMIAILAWSLPNARQQAFMVIFAITYVVAIGGFSHSIVGSDEAFLLLFSGNVGVWQALGALILPAVLGNLLGGAGLFALLAHAQVRGEMDGQGET